MKCQKCQKEVFLPFRCQYCGDYFCSEHRLPENHECRRIEYAHSRVEEKPVFSVQNQKQEPYEYSISYVPTKTPKRGMGFSNREIKHLAIGSLLVIGIGLSSGIFQFGSAMEEPTMLILFATILTMSFFVHEIAHKIVAQRKGLWAEFRLTLMGAVLTLFSIVSPYFKIISPGAVMISGFAEKDNIGKISIAGPITNMILSMLFLGVAQLVSQYALILIFLLGAAINAWIALFNLIPFGVLDGFKIFLWSKTVWALAFAVSLILTIIAYGLIM